MAIISTVFPAYTLTPGGVFVPDVGKRPTMHINRENLGAMVYPP